VKTDKFQTDTWTETLGEASRTIKNPNNNCLSHRMMEVVAGGGEDGVDGVVPPVPEVIASHDWAPSQWLA
jgi:hypothetical protein